jgi:hypothetical protein
VSTELLIFKLIGAMVYSTWPSGANTYSSSDLGKFVDFFFIRRALPISGVKVAAPIVLAQHKRPGEVRKHISHVAPTVKVFALQLFSTERKRK